jgi:hypothetical protein
MSPTDSKPRRLRARPRAEALESRDLLTGGAGNTFAIVSDSVDNPGGVVTVPFTLDPAHIHLPRGKLALGIDVATPTGSTASPYIDIVLGPNSKPIRQTVHTVFPGAKGAAPSNATGAVISQISIPRSQGNKPVAFAVQVSALNDTSGKFLLGFYLPGDANGDGKVDKTDIQAIRAAMNSVSGDQRYNFDADSNRDGRVNAADLALARQDMGVSTDISPDLSSQIDPTSITSTTARETTVPLARFTGSGTPGATITYQATDQTTSPVTATVDATGNYAIMTPLKPGLNTFKVTSVDAFGQTISGTIAPVLLDPPGSSGSATPATAPATATPTTTPTTAQEQLVPPTAATPRGPAALKRAAQPHRKAHSGY